MTGPEQHANTVERLAEEIADSATILYGNELVALAERADTLERDLFAARQAVLTEGLAAVRLREALREIRAEAENELLDYRARCLMIVAAVESALTEPQIKQKVEDLEDVVRDLLESYEFAISCEKGPPGPREKQGIDRALKALDALVDLAKQAVAE